MIYFQMHWTFPNNLLKNTNGHPYYTQLLFRELYFFALSQRKPIDVEAVKIATAEAIGIEDMYFSTLWEDVGKNSAQVAVLKALAENNKKLFNKNMKIIINVTRTVNQLIKKGILKKNEKGQYEFTDMLFKEYIKQRLL
jgi:hypothetical protein